ncbi:MAG: DNA-3-methyladenine glycosylase 2 family protein [Streptosporangiales bacterium]|nr:DNA-3-methyladenine glycosylase 2 family protein [Streptosporangiales bacterium]
MGCGGGQTGRVLERTWRPPWPLDVARVLGVHRRGHGDPAYRVAGDGAVWRASTTPDGPVSVRIVSRPRGGEVHATAYGPGAAWQLDALPELLGAADDPGSLVPVHPQVTDGVRRLPGLRVGRSRRVFESLVPAVLEQKVVGLEAFRAWRLLLRRFGEPAPGPHELRLVVPPPPEVWMKVPSWEWHRAGAEAVRARTVIGAARVAARLEETLELPAEEADRRLRSLPGVGVWTSAEVRQRAHGDADAVSVGDYHIPSMVAWSLVGERKADDARMLELLAPYAGHRHRVAMLLMGSGGTPPRRGPRNPVRDYRRI